MDTEHNEKSSAIEKNLFRVNAQDNCPNKALALYIKSMR